MFNWHFSSNVLNSRINKDACLTFLLHVLIYVLFILYLNMFVYMLCLFVFTIKHLLGYCLCCDVGLDRIISLCLSCLTCMMGQQHHSGPWVLKEVSRDLPYKYQYNIFFCKSQLRLKYRQYLITHIFLDYNIRLLLLIYQRESKILLLL